MLHDVKRSAKAKVVRMRFIRPCHKCCCFDHITFDCQSQSNEDLYGGGRILSKFQTEALCSPPSQWSDGSWLLQEQYDEEIWSLGTFDKNLVALVASKNVSIVVAATLGINLYYPGKCFPGDSYHSKYYSLI